MNWKTSKAAGVPRYVGKMCSKHPSAGGVRYTANCGCVSCRLESVRKYIKTESGKEKRATYSAKYDNLPQVKRKRQLYRLSGRFDEKAYRRRPGVKAKIAARNRSTERRNYMAAYQITPNQKARRAIARRIRRQHVSRFATPTWADKGRIAKSYKEAERRTKNTAERHVVDHVIPLKHPKICGLHVAENLQVLTYQENAEKSNHFEVG